jgi:hypothetical protein
VATGIGGLIGDILDPMIEGAVNKAAANMAAKYPDITPAMQTEMAQGTMVEIQLALDMYKSSQQAAATP